MKKIITLTLIGISSAAIVGLGSLITADRTKYQNAFTRVFPPHAADLNSVIETKRQVYISGLTNKQLYLRDRFGILISNLSLRDTIRIYLDTPFGAEAIVDSPFFYVHDGSRAILQRGNMSNWMVDTTFSGIRGFTAIQPFSENEAIIRTMNISERENLLMDQEGNQKYLLEKQVDGLLCTDGFLLYSKELGQIVYLYRYRNKFICFDTCLNVIRHGNTIDTTSVAKISVAEIDGKVTMAKPPLSVNNYACVDRKYLFVSSNLLAKNENADIARSKTVIDVYNILDGSYRFSFYIDNQDSKIQEFRVRNNKLLAVFKKYVSIHDIPSVYLP